LVALLLNMDTRFATTTGMRQRFLLLATMTAALGLAACGSVTQVGDGGSGQAGSGQAGSGGSGPAGSGSGQAGSGSGQAGSGSGQAGSGQAGSGGSGQAGSGPRDGGGDAAGDGGGNPCHGLTEPECRVKAGCAVASCAGCTGGSIFGGCYQPATESPPPCPGFACPVKCAGLPEAACTARPDCRTDYCPGCQTKSFVKCAAPTDPPPTCPAIACPLPCGQVTTLDQCEARNDCHSVFVDPGTCGCAAVGCCAHFSRCADGNTARCTGIPACDAAIPFCEGPYVVAYTATCYEGCVKKTDCAP
jgi:hypothetical protein